MLNQHLSQKMDALVWRGPREMAMQSVPVADLEDGEVLVEVGAVGICRSELNGYLGRSGLRKPPLIMGHELAGRIVRVNRGRLIDGTPPLVGTRVAVNPLVTCGKCDRCRSGRSNVCRSRSILGVHRPGAFARFVAVPAGQCWPLPHHLSDVAASLTEPLASAVRSVTISRISAGQSLLILGCDPVGLCCLAVAHGLGITTIVVSDTSDTRLEIATRWGATTAVGARHGDVVTATQALQLGGVHAAIDTVGTDATRRQALQAVMPGGQVVLVGLEAEASPVAVNYLIRQEIAAAGSYGYTDADFAHALELLTAGVIRPDTDWLEERPLSAGPRAFAELVAERVDVARIVLCQA